MRKLIPILLFALICMPAAAQRGFSGARGGHFSGRFSSQRGGRYWPGYTSLPFFWDSFYPDDLLDSGYAAGAAPAFIVVQQAPAPQAAEPIHAAQPPLLIEFRGGRYVRVDDAQSSDAQNVGVQPAASDANANAVRAIPISSTLPSTILVFRDGSRKEISDYTIADGMLYAKSNYYTDGSWNKEIPISSLDLTVTVNENQARGVPFQLPSAPNQVIVGP